MKIEEAIEKIKQELQKIPKTEETGEDEEIKQALIDLIREEPELIAKYVRETGLPPEDIVRSLLEGAGITPDERLIRQLADIVKRRL